MVSKEEYTKYIKELTLKDKERIKKLYGNYLAWSFFALFIGAFILFSEVYSFVVFHYVSFGFLFVVEQLSK